MTPKRRRIHLITQDIDTRGCAKPLKFSKAAFLVCTCHIIIRALGKTRLQQLWNVSAISGQVQNLTAIIRTSCRGSDCCDVRYGDQRQELDYLSVTRKLGNAHLDIPSDNFLPKAVRVNVDFFSSGITTQRKREPRAITERANTREECPGLVEKTQVQ